MSAPLVHDDDEATRKERRAAVPPPMAHHEFLRGLAGGITVGTFGVFFASFLVAASVHLAVAAGAATVPLPQREERVQMKIYKPPPPAPPEPEPPPPPEPEPKKEPPKPRPKEIPQETLPPPPPNQEPPPEAPPEPVPIVTGISMSSTVKNGAGMKVRVGNTTYGDPNKENFVPADDVKPYAGGSKDFEPVRAANVSSPAKVVQEYRPKYPRQVKEEGVEGVVILRVQVTREGKTRGAKLVKGIHPVLDNLSLQAIERFLWKPAEVDGQAVDSIITYKMTWELFD